MMKQLIALILVLCLTLSGCDMVDFGGYFSMIGDYLVGFNGTHFRNMVYTRPDMTALNQALLDAVDGLDTEAVDDAMDDIYDFYGAYWDFYTAYSLSYIHYSGDLTDTYWEAEYTYCVNHSTEVDAAIDELFYAIADSPLREELEGEDYFGADFFDDYEGESIWDETFTALMEEESYLINRYYTLSEELMDAPDHYAVCADMETLFVELVKLRQEIASYLGYESYVDFAYEFYYDRDYTPAQAKPYLAEIQQELVPLYRQQNRADSYNLGRKSCTEEEMFAYVQQVVSDMGGTVEEAFYSLDNRGLYDIAYSDKKYNSSYEIYLYNYDCPFIFVNPKGNQWDKLTFAHEFGHFANDYASYGSSSCIDVAEFFSQGFEYLSLFYGSQNKTLTEMKLADSLALTVEQSAYAAFEHQVYDLPAEELTEDRVRGLYEEVCTAYGFDSWGFDSRDFVTINHFFTNPLYVISYVVSNDIAFQLYQLEKDQHGEGLRLYETHLDAGGEYFLEFVAEVGLENPFTPGRIATVRETLEEILK
jgi:hypothetical protein